MQDLGLLSSGGFRTGIPKQKAPKQTGSQLCFFLACLGDFGEGFESSSSERSRERGQTFTNLPDGGLNLLWVSVGPWSETIWWTMAGDHWTMAGDRVEVTEAVLLMIYLLSDLTC